MAEQNQEDKNSTELKGYQKQKARADAAELQVEDLTAKLKDLPRLKSVESELSEVKSQLSKAQSELNTANSNLTSIKKQNADLTSQLSGLKQGNQNLTTVNSELEEVKRELNQVKSDFDNLTNESNELKRINEDLKKDVARLTGIESDLTKQAAGLKGDIEKLTAINKDLTEKNEALNWDSEQLKQINDAKSKQNYWGMIALNTLMVFTALAASFANVIHLGERYLALIKDATDLDRIVCYVSMTVFDLCIFFFAIYGKKILARFFAGAIMFIVFTKLSKPFFEYGFTSEYAERFLVGMAFSGFLAFVSVIMSEVIAEKINKKLNN